jgi:hypothetical protein
MGAVLVETVHDQQQIPAPGRGGVGSALPQVSPAKHASTSDELGGAVDVTAGRARHAVVDARLFRGHRVVIQTPWGPT